MTFVAPTANAAELSQGCQDINGDSYYDDQYTGRLPPDSVIAAGEVVTVTAGPPDNVEPTDPPMRIKLELRSADDLSELSVGEVIAEFPGTVSMVAPEPSHVAWQLHGPNGGFGGSSVATWEVSCGLATRFNDWTGVVDTATGIWNLTLNDFTMTSFYFGDPGDYPIMGDWDCNGIDTPGLYRQSDGYVYLRNSNTQGIADIRFFFGNPGDVPLAGDFNADGCDTVSIYRPREARIYVINELGSDDGGLGAADFDFYFGNLGDKPFVADFNGDGIDTVGLHRESTGFVYYRDALTSGIAEREFFFGDPDDQILGGHWKGSSTGGADTVGIYRPSDGMSYLRWSNTQGPADLVETPRVFPAPEAPVAVSGFFGNSLPVPPG
jgi:hypothetical protein